MNKVKRSLDNQAIGLVPLLLFMFWIIIFIFVILHNRRYLLFRLYFLVSDPE